MRVTFILSLLREDIVRALFWTLVHSLWQGLALAILTGLVILLTRRSSPALRYNVLTGAFCIFLVGAGITFFLQLRGGGISSVPLPGAPASFSPVPPAEMPVMGVLFASGGSSWAGRWVGWLNQRAGFIVTCWFIILFIRLVKLLTDLGAVQRLRYYRTSVPDGHWQQRVMELARQMGIKRAVGLLESSLIRVPMMAGMLKPVILAPLGLLAQLPPSQVEAILLHELAHIRRKDYLVNLLQSLAETLFFFNPAVLWISSLIREERENCCDDIAVGEARSKKEFIHALVSFQEYSQPVSRHAIAFPGAKNHLLERIRRIVYNDNKTLNIREKFFFLACLLITAGLTLAYAQHDPVVVRPVRPVIADTSKPVVTRDTSITPEERREWERKMRRQQELMEEQQRRLDQARQELDEKGITTISADLLDDRQLQSLPDVRNVLYLAGTKFGTTGNESYTWAMNSYLPGRVAEKYRHSNIVVFSTGNVYPLTPVVQGGASETDPPGPLGEYAQSCLGRERIFQYSSSKHNTPILIYRLNYANDLSYGVLLEIARSVKADKPIDLRMGNVNVIWQGDANEIAIRSLLHCSAPSKILNVTGPEILSVRWIAQEFGKLFGKTPLFTGEEQSTALLSNAAECSRLFGYPTVPPKKMIELLAAWIDQGGATIDKETHFQERTGKY